MMNQLLIFLGILTTIGVVPWWVGHCAAKRGYDCPLADSGLEEGHGYPQAESVPDKWLAGVEVIMFTTIMTTMVGVVPGVVVLAVWKLVGR